MSVVTIANEAKELLSIWNSLTGCSIAFEIENTDLGVTCQMIECKQGVGTRKGSWDDIPSGNCEECGTQHDGVFGTGNLGGVVYKINSGLFFGLIWADPSVGPSQYGYAYGDEKDVKAYVEKAWGSWFTCLPISGGASRTLNLGSVNIQIQPGFDPFKVKFYLPTKEEMNTSKVENFSVGITKIDEPTSLGEMISRR